MVCVFKGENNLLAALLQSLSARIRVWRRQRRGQSDCSREVHRVIHGQDQAGAPDCHLMFHRRELLVQSFVKQADPGACGGGAVAVDGAGASVVGADSDVGVQGAHTGVIQDKVRIIIVELTFILRCGDRRIIQISSSRAKDEPSCRSLEDKMATDTLVNKLI